MAIIDADTDADTHAGAARSAGRAATLPADARPALRLLTCGSVDDGKSTLIGRLLVESDQVHADHLAQLDADSRRYGTQGAERDLALLVDGLAAEREQGITIDIAYRYVTTRTRHLVIADTPGHVEYTRNMVSAASTADLAVVLVDARHGVVTQTRRHTYLAALMGIGSLVLVVNKMDLVGWATDAVGRVRTEFTAYARQLGIDDVVVIPASALAGDNVTVRSERMPWYEGPTLLGHLEQVEPRTRSASGPFRMPVQWVNHPDPGFRGYSGTVVGGTVGPGDVVTLMPAGTHTTVARVVTADVDLPRAEPGQAVTLVLGDDVDVSRGDVVCSAAEPVPATDRFEAHVVWLSDQPMAPTRAYDFKLATRTGALTLGEPRYSIDIDTLAPSRSAALRANEIAVCSVRLDRRVAVEPYAVSRELGGFIVIDRPTGDTVAAGLVDVLGGSGAQLGRTAAAEGGRSPLASTHQRPGVVWFTGISGAGKSTLANEVHRQLKAAGRHTYVLDGDVIRHGLNRDLGFSEADRAENVRRISEVARLLADAGLLVLVACISPFRADRARARSLVAEGEFVEVFVDTAVEVAQARDTKGLYARALRGELPHFTGISSPYEAPEHPEVHVDTSLQSVDEGAQAVIASLRAAGILP